MSRHTLIDIIRQAADELGLPRPASAVASDPQTRQLVALANAVCRDILQEHAWSLQHTLATVTSVAGQSDYAIPDDFDRIIDDTEWDSTNHWRLVGPQTPQQARALIESGLTWTGTTMFRLFGSSTIRLWPTPTVDNQLFAYEYVSENWGRDTDGNRKDRMTSDTDTSIFDPQLVVKGMKVAFMQAKGFDTSTLVPSYLHTLNRRIADDIGGGVLDMGQEGNGLTSEIAPGSINGGAGSGGASPSSPSGGSGGAGVLDGDGFYIILE